MAENRKLIAGLLTVNALLLAAHLWVRVAETPILAGPAAAQVQNLPNAGAQRAQMIALLERIRQSVERTSEILERERVKVVVEPPADGPKQPAKPAPR